MTDAPWNDPRHGEPTTGDNDRHDPRFDAVSTTLYGTALDTVILVPAAVLEEGVERTLAVVGGAVVPIVGVLSSVALLGEQLGPLTVVGGAVVLVGLWLVEHRASGDSTTRVPAGADGSRA